MPLSTQIKSILEPMVQDLVLSEKTTRRLVWDVAIDGATADLSSATQAIFAVAVDWATAPFLTKTGTPSGGTVTIDLTAADLDALDAAAAAGLNPATIGVYVLRLGDAGTERQLIATGGVTYYRNTSTTS